MTASTSLHLAYGLVALTLLLTSTGCIWRTADTDHFWGPILIRANQPPQGNAFLWEERSVVPLVAEGGNHIGLTIGFLKRLAANPIEIDKKASLRWCYGLLNTSCSIPTVSDGWYWSFLYSRITHNASPEFYDRYVLGASVGAGSDGYQATLGYSADTRQKPQDNAYYIFCYRRTNPFQTRFELTRHTTAFITFLDQEAC